jgi:hypothetical protein
MIATADTAGIEIRKDEGVTMKDEMLRGCLSFRVHLSSFIVSSVSLVAKSVSMNATNK